MNSKAVCITEDEVVQVLKAQKEEKVENMKKFGKLERKWQNNERKKKYESY